MSITDNLKKKVLKRSRLQDIIFISGMLAFSAALVLGLFPESDIQGTQREYFTFLIMTIPVIGAIYYIFISWVRKYFKTFDFSSSIIFKMMLAFFSVAVLPAIVIIIISNHIINITISNLITDRTIYALQESINSSGEYIQSYYDQIDGELKSLYYSIGRGAINPVLESHRSMILENYNLKGLICGIYKIERNGPNIIIKRLVNNNKFKKYEAGITKYFENVDLDSLSKISNISIGRESILLGQITYRGFIVAIVKDIPGAVYSRLGVYKDSLNRYSRHEFLTPYFQTGVGTLLLASAILIVVISISVSIFLSKGITRPVLELAEAAGHVASGNFQISLRRDSSDEVGLLFKSFNKMVKQLDESKKIMYQAQRLQAWREVARRLVHEIKNPLTPIRLSAERIQNRYTEGHPDIRNIIVSGTETIIEEVRVLDRMLDEFSKFARLPEINAELQDINPIIENCVNIFLAHEKISFHLDLSKKIPRLFVDKLLLRQALINIIQNSIDAISGKGNIYITSSLSDKDKGIAGISIRDDGPGIEARDMERIFDPTFSTKEKGTGLGLAIVEKIVLEHNGKVFCHSEKGEGAEFVIEFPLLEVKAGGKNIIG